MFPSLLGQAIDSFRLCTFRAGDWYWVFWYVLHTYAKCAPLSAGILYNKPERLLNVKSAAGTGGCTNRPSLVAIYLLCLQVQHLPATASHTVLSYRETREWDGAWYHVKTRYRESPRGDGASLQCTAALKDRYLLSALMQCQELGRAAGGIERCVEGGWVIRS